MSIYYVGWDVGAWHCDSNSKSKDALFISDKLYKRLCIRDQLKNETVEGFLNECLDKNCFGNEDAFYFAIDAVFSWPEAFLNLLNKSTTEEAIPAKFSINPFLFRYTEQEISGKLNKQPQSVVQNQIGSQSTKIIFFLQKYNFQREKVGVWKIPNRKIYAIETYPALLSLSEGNNELVRSNQDLIDAQKCQHLAQMFATNQGSLMSPSDYCNAHELLERIRDEGWIWLPKSAWPENKSENSSCLTPAKTN